MLPAYDPFDTSDVGDSKGNKTGKSRNLDTEIPKILRQNGLVDTKKDDLEKVRIRSRESIHTPKFMTTLIRQLRSNKAESLENQQSNLVGKFPPN